MKIKYYITMLLSLTLFLCQAQIGKEVYKSENLIIQKLTDNTYVHVSYLKTQDFGNVACNGMVFIAGDKALVFDTPTDNGSSKELIKWLKDEMQCEINGVIATHFHDDCIGGLSEFHENGINSYASEQTIALVSEQQIDIPKTALDFEKGLELNDKKVTNLYFGEGHTKDNIVCYIPSEKVLFGGCLIKTVGATKGYLGDANTAEWSNTVEKIKEKLPDLKYIIPGHGKNGSSELFDYTIKLFDEFSK